MPSSTPDPTISHQDPGSTPLSAAWLPAGCFDGQVAVVTGGGTGLGLQISRGLASLGATVVIASRSAEHHEVFLSECAERGWSGESEVFDVREDIAVRELSERILERHGRVDILVNNAAGNFVCPAERLSKNAWRAVLGIVLDGTFFCSKHFGRSMLAAGSGSILNIVATYAWTGMPGVVHSASAKAGVLAMTKTLAGEWAGRGLRVNAIAPGPFHSDGAQKNLWPDQEVEDHMRAQIPLGRFADVNEVAAHGLYLLSPAASYITGECLVIDGGLTVGAGRMWDQKSLRPGRGQHDAEADDAEGSGA
ncbi:MAG: NAD(P)-dependent dehydrogenase (short-subunit alcohol dehydrogenase family) [Planctomycetota bacterium]|jgi:NAD(P)-dependent dehydrogenase (short-subunit alcohol dehydrogenase family)